MTEVPKDSDLAKAFVQQNPYGTLREFAAYVKEQTGREIKRKRASQILNKYEPNRPRSTRSESVRRAHQPRRDEINQRIDPYLRSNLSASAIAQQLGGEFSPGQVRRARNAQGDTAQHRREERDRRILAYPDNVSQKEIAQRERISQSEVSLAQRRNGRGRGKRGPVGYHWIKIT